MLVYLPWVLNTSRPGEKCAWPRWEDTAHQRQRPSPARPSWDQDQVPQNDLQAPAPHHTGFATFLQHFRAACVCHCPCLCLSLCLQVPPLGWPGELLLVTESPRRTMRWLICALRTQALAWTPVTRDQKCGLTWPLVLVLDGSRTPSWQSRTPRA